MIYIDEDTVISFHEKLIKRYGGLRGIRDLGLLRSSIESVFQTYDGEELYPYDIDKIIQVSYSLIKNHCFYDGNKRIAMMVLIYLLSVNNIKHILSNEDIIEIGLGLASGSMIKDEFKDKIEDKLI